MVKESAFFGAQENTTKLIPYDQFINEAVTLGVKFGKTNPYHRIRYYIKLGLLPNPIRKVDPRFPFDPDKPPHTVGHFPIWAADRLWEIEKLRSLGLSANAVRSRLTPLPQDGKRFPAPTLANQTTPNQIPNRIDPPPTNRIEPLPTEDRQGRRLSPLLPNLAYAFLTLVLIIATYSTTLYALYPQEANEFLNNKSRVLGASDSNGDTLLEKVGGAFKFVLTPFSRMTLGLLKISMPESTPHADPLGVTQLDRAFVYDIDGNLVARLPISFESAKLLVQDEGLVEQLNADLLDGHHAGIESGQVLVLDEEGDVDIAGGASFGTNVTVGGKLTVKKFVGSGAGVTNLSVTNVTGTFSSTSLPSTLIYTSTSYANPSWITSITWTKITSTPNIISSLDGVVNDEGNINLIGVGGIAITPNDAANTITIGGGGVGGFVSLAPAAADSDTSANPSIFINDTGGGNLLQLQTGGTDRFVIDNSGNVGIGTTGPGANLDVQDTISGSSGANTLLVLTGQEALGADLAIGDGVRLLFKIPYNGELSRVGAAIDAVKTSGLDNDSSTSLVFSTSQNDETLDVAMVIDENGNVNITGDLDVSGHGAFGSGASVDSARILNAVETLTATSGTVSAIRGTANINPSSAPGSALNVRAIYGYTETIGSNINEWVSLSGLRGQAVHGTSGTLGSAEGLRVHVQNTNTGIISDAYGVRVLSAVNSGAGSITDNYGLYIEDQTVGDTNYAIYLEDQSSGDYGICFDCDGTYDNAVAANGITWGTDANGVNLYRSANDTLQTNDKVIIAGGNTATSLSADILTLNGTLTAMDGSDTLRGIFLDFTNPDHTVGSNIFNAIDIDTITGDDEATETAINIGSGWDNTIRVADGDMTLRLGGVNDNVIMNNVTDLVINTSSSGALPNGIVINSPDNGRPGIRFVDNGGSVDDWLIQQFQNEFSIRNYTDNRYDIRIYGSGNIDIGAEDVTKTINIGTGTAADTINIGTGDTTADTINFGDTNVATTFNFDSGVTATTGLTYNADSVDSGTGATFSFDGLTTGSGLDVASTSISGAGGRLVQLTADFDGTPGGSQYGLKVDTTNNPTVANTAYGIYSFLDDQAGSTTSTLYGVYGSVSAGNLADTAYAIYGNGGDAAIFAANTTGTGLQAATSSGSGLVVSSTALNTNNAVDISSTSTSTSSDLIQGDHTATYAGTATVDGNLLDLSRDLTADSGVFSFTLTIDGDVANLTSNCTEVGDDSCDDTSNILELNQQYATASGAVLNILNAGTGAGILFEQGTTVTDGIQWGTDANAVNLYRSANDTLQTDDKFILNFDNANQTSADYLTLSGDVGDFDGSEVIRGIFVDLTNGTHSGTNTLTGIDIDAIAGSGSATETAINIGSGWDTEIFFADTTPTIDVANDASARTLLIQNPGAGTANLQVHGDVLVGSSTLPTAGAIRIANDAYLTGIDSLGNVNIPLIGVNASNQIVLGPAGGGGIYDVRTVYPIVIVNNTTTASSLYVETNSLTSGYGLNVNSTATAFTGDLGRFSLTGSNAANTGPVLNVQNTGTLNTNTTLYVKHFATGAGNLAFRVDDVSGDTTPFVIDGTGQVGIGKVDPGASLSLGSALGNKLFIYESLGWAHGFGIQANTFEMFMDSSTDIIKIGYGTSGSVTEVMRIKGTGEVGIGDTTPTETLTVADNFVGYAGSFFNDGNLDTHQGVFIQACADANPGAACNFLELRDGDGGILGAIEGTGGGGVTNASAGGDYAELFRGNPSNFEAGDVIALGETGEVVKAVGGSSLLGVFSTNSNNLGNWHDGWEETGEWVPVGLLGQITTKVSGENGSIRPGDVLTTSSIPGVAMKATKSGPIIGKALESYSGSGVGKIMVFVSTGWYVAPIAESSEQLADLSGISVSSLTASTIHTDVLFIGDRKLAMSEDGKLVVDGTVNILGDIVVDGDTKIAGDLKVGNVLPANKLVVGEISLESSGNATLPAGKTKIFVPALSLTSRSQVSITTTTLTGNNFNVTEKVAGQGFTVEVVSPEDKDINFDWFIVN